MTSFVDLPAYLVLEAAEATLQKLGQALEARKAMLRAKLREAREVLFVFTRVYSDAEIDTALTDPRLQTAIWAGEDDPYLRAFKLMALATAAVQAGLEGRVSVTADVALYETLRPLFKVFKVLRLHETCDTRVRWRCAAETKPRSRPQWQRPATMAPSGRSPLFRSTTPG